MNLSKENLKKKQKKGVKLGFGFLFSFINHYLGTYYFCTFCKEKSYNPLSSITYHYHEIFIIQVLTTYIPIISDKSITFVLHSFHLIIFHILMYYLGFTGDSDLKQGFSKHFREGDQYSHYNRQDLHHMEDSTYDT